MIGYKQIEVLKAMKSGEIVRIDGYCASACTLHVANPRACATGRAILIFHIATNSAGTKFLWRSYPAKIRAYISANGGFTRKRIIARGAVAQRLIGSCGG